MQPVECWTLLDGESSNVKPILQQAPIGKHSLAGASFNLFLYYSCASWHPQQLLALKNLTYAHQENGFKHLSLWWTPLYKVSFSSGSQPLSDMLPQPCQMTWRISSAPSIIFQMFSNKLITNRRFFNTTVLRKWLLPKKIVSDCCLGQGCMVSAITTFLTV